MRAEGKPLAEIATVFGLKSERAVQHRIAIGNILFLSEAQGARGCTLTYEDAVQYLLPLRIQIGNEPSGAPVWNDHEVTHCIKQLIKGDLTREDLPAYSTERRLAIVQAQQEARVKEAAAAETKSAGWKTVTRRYFESPVSRYKSVLVI